MYASFLSYPARLVLPTCYNSCVDKTLTIRLDKRQNEALTRRARALGKTRSELVRELIDKGLEDQALGALVGHLEGVLEFPASQDTLRRRIKDRNWR
jgi:hypothetical protein